MNKRLPQILTPGRLGDLGFVVVVFTAYLSALATLAYGRRAFTSFEIALLAAASVAYLLVGTFGFAYCKRAGSIKSAIGYFALQILLAATIMQMTRGGFVWLILLPLASQSVILLPRRWSLVVCAVLTAVVIVSIGSGATWTAGAVIGSIFLAGVVFVVVFTQIAVNERQARAEVERLATELGAANRKLREYAVKVEELATAKERNRLAREIHDSLGHYLTVINVQIEAARTVLATDRDGAFDALHKAQSLAREGLADVRRSVAALRVAPTENLPLPQAVAALIEESRAAGLNTELIVLGAPQPLTPQAEQTFYRAAQEGLTNVRKHAQAQRATLTLDYRDERAVKLIVEDNGVGCSASGGGFGLLGVRERAQLLGGALRTRTTAGQGFTLEVEAPR